MTQSVRNGSVGAQPRGWAGRARQKLKPKGLFVGEKPVPCLFHGIENICYAHRLESKGIENLSNPNPGQIRGLSVRVDRSWGGKELGSFNKGGTLVCRSGQAERQPCCLPSREWEGNVKDVCLEFTYTNRMEPVMQRNQQLTRR